ncbi:DEAD-box ATP-dependent RNA helicase [Musa troglodytarum]|uniref:DEAD-box ATP-dependent RNA helicase n=1 Tax=Musa troglodytarum TaxID=320322 RepID=A0A9E7JA88_9LILI|nr:DEAD-box ATP-dependent RNA helicase [Musa troglodytarum]URD73769.1 DEAD-box ATP-dependent RNA helicase [Musa troglodytarum]
MLASSAPPPPFLQKDLPFSSSLQSPLLPPLLSPTRRLLALRRRCGCSFERASREERAESPVVAAASGRRGYERIPMETAGAYRLVDRETGEKFIVWGGSDDNDDADTPIPSAEVLSWKPPSADGRQGGVDATMPIDEIGNKKVAPAGGSLRSFGRLKAQKVKSLIKKTSKNYMDDSKIGSVTVVGDSPSSDTNRTDSFGCGRAQGLKDSDLKDNSTVNEETEATNSLQLNSREDDYASFLDRSVPRNASFRGWGGAASNQAGTAVWSKQHKKMATDAGFFSRKSFEDVGCTDDMVAALRGLMFLRPSHIQAMAYGPIIEGKTCIIADQSGSGKTLAYLAPTLQCIRQEEILGLGKASSRSPRVIILVPTAELASQVLSNCRSIAKYGVPFRSMVATGGFRQKTQLDNLNEESDVLIATPGRFMYLLQEGFLQLTNLRCVVVDEVDILFRDEGFEHVLESFISSAPVSAQYLFVTATLPVDIYNKVVEIFPDSEVIMGPGMHRTSSGLEEVLVDCSGTDGEKNPDTAFQNKKSALLQLLEDLPVPKTIVFCNKIETCRKVENVLNRFDRKGSQIQVLPFHAAIAQEIRLSNMREFLNSRSKDSKFLICTDRASRGIDFAGVDHVVLFDFPRDPSEYVRRVGRTARGAGGKGKAYVFVVGKQVSLARRIMERNKKGHPLHDLPCASLVP